MSAGEPLDETPSDSQGNFSLSKDRKKQKKCYVKRIFTSKGMPAGEVNLWIRPLQLSHVHHYLPLLIKNIPPQ